ncbi:hypothetical protein M758_12G008800 [Ceratodon purpureus]|nr:hypothetical protein M758_12G008800 [Ceratodon purpureus]
MEAASEAMDSEAEAEAVEVALQSGLVALRGKNAAFMDPVRVLNAGYEAHHVRSDRYYARAFFTSTVEPVPGDADGEESRKRKRKRKVYTPNAKEAVAESRHQEVRSVILEAHEAFQKTVAPFLRKHIVFSDDDNCIASPSKSCTVPQKPTVEEGELNFVELAALWQAPLYEISFMESIDGQFGCEEEDPGTTALFNTVFENSSATSKAAQCGGCKYLLPKLSKFLISDIPELHQLIPGVSGDGFNLMVIDPPWENKSVHRKALYPTLPNRYLLSLPVKQLGHTDGALVALWITNREKLRHFAETELFPAWGVSLAAVWYWLKVTAEGTMVSPLDLAHHKPYECLLLGYLPSKGGLSSEEENVPSLDSRGRVDLPDKYVLMSIPGDHSRKPPLKSILSKYIPRQGHGEKGLELFARELNAGWTSWGNEPLRFQHLSYFCER